MRLKSKPRTEINEIVFLERTWLGEQELNVTCEDVTRPRPSLLRTFTRVWGCFSRSRRKRIWFSSLSVCLCVSLSPPHTLTVWTLPTALLATYTRQIQTVRCPVSSLHKPRNCNGVCRRVQVAQRRMACSCLHDLWSTAAGQARARRRTKGDKHHGTRRRWGRRPECGTEPATGPPRKTHKVDEEPVPA